MSNKYFDYDKISNAGRRYCNDLSMKILLQARNPLTPFPETVYVNVTMNLCVFASCTHKKNTFSRKFK